MIDFLITIPSSTFAVVRPMTDEGRTWLDQKTTQTLNGGAEASCANLAILTTLLRASRPTGSPADKENTNG